MTQVPEGARAIELTKGRIALVDEGDYDRVSDRLWQLVERGRYFYACHSWRDGMGSEAPVRKTYLHREVIGAPEGFQVRFNSPDTLDCRRANLKFAGAR